MLSDEDREATWIAVVDDCQGRLFRGHRVRSGTGSRLRLELVETLENDLRELDLSAHLSAQGRDPHAVGSRNAELYARYAADTARWLTLQIQRRRLGELEVFASLRLQTFLRPMYPVTARELVKEHSIRLEGQSVRDLECHPGLIQALGGRRREGSKRAS